MIQKQTLQTKENQTDIEYIKETQTLQRDSHVYGCRFHQILRLTEPINGTENPRFFGSV